MDNKNSSSYSRSSYNDYSSSKKSDYNYHGEFHMGPVEPRNVDNFGPCGIKIPPK